MRYIVMEGLDSVGKTTQSKMLVEYLSAQGKKAVWTREPGSPLIDLNVRDLALSHKKITPQTLELLMVADRAEHTTKIKELLDSNTYDVVVSDRSFVSGMAYGIACGHKEEALMNLYDYAIQIYPDHVFILNLTLEEAERRREARGETATREEVKGLEFKQTVQKNFGLVAELYENLPGVKTKFTVIDATQSKEEIFERILRGLELL